jgi:ATP-dependent protease ClpP protease subunit
MTDIYDLHEIDYSVQGWDTILATDMQILDAVIPARIIVTLGETVSAYDALMIKSDGKAYKAKADGTLQPALGLALESGDATDEIRMYIMGGVVNASWTWTIGGAIYLSTATAGALTQSKPVANVQVIGIAVSATKLLLTSLQSASQSYA